MVWEQETRVIVMLTDFVEKGIDKCADYLPPSETLDCHRVYGEFQVTLKSRDMKEKFVVSNVQLKNLETTWSEKWPTCGSLGGPQPVFLMRNLASYPSSLRSEGTGRSFEPKDLLWGPCRYFFLLLFS
ncbi:tyrosine-protein phosphatase non-receptor type 1-like [Penaeus monodon]|uniref:tyrosine-protein phosphatase non-receptor type 1-like n=1 Tax=Penaeus monodon TaxID=6687 RepID=UPI0018A77DDD|nr:tyrosine-protein phosphatase non-receptor type 1-like [Penaeus monodon]